MWSRLLIVAAFAGAPLAAQDRIPEPAAMVAMDRIVAVGGEPAVTPSTLGLASPDGRWLIFRVRHADIGRDRNIDRIMLVSRARIGAFLRSGAPAQVRPILSVEAREYSRGIHQLRWIGVDLLGFLAPDERDVAQAFVIDVTTGERRQLTDSATPVVAFDLAGERVVYEALAPSSRGRAPATIDVSSARLEDLLFDSRDRNFPLLELHVAQAGGAAARRLGVRPFRMLPYFQRIWLSPDGRHAAILYPAVSPPPDWSRYRTRNPAVNGFGEDRRSDDPTDPTLALRHRFLLVDLASGMARDLVDAPDGWMSFNATLPQAFWSADGRRVLLLSVYRPFAGAGHGVRLRDPLGPGIVEVDIASGRWTAVGGEAPAGLAALLDPLGRVAEARWDPVAQRLLLSLADGAEMRRVELARRGRWRIRSLPMSPEPLRLVLDQGMNQRPRLFAEDRDCDCRRMIFDPDPAASAFRFAHAREIRWTDGNGISWRGGLLTPPGMTEPRPLPLVVQTHGFDPSEFLVDGARGDATSMAAQALVGAGFAVLQVEENRRAFTSDRREAELNAEGYRAAIDAVVREGWADRDRVGLTAWSRTGLSSILLLARHPDLLRAYQLSDGAWWGYLNELAIQNGSRDLAAAYHELTGPAPTGDGIQAWARNSPLHQLFRSPAAIRITANGRFSLLMHWEHYAMLRSRPAATEIVWFPEGSHDLEGPLERLESQRGTVEFFQRALAARSAPARR